MKTGPLLVMEYLYIVALRLICVKDLNASSYTGDMFIAVSLFKFVKKKALS